MARRRRLGFAGAEQEHREAAQEEQDQWEPRFKQVEEMLKIGDCEGASRELDRYMAFQGQQTCEAYHSGDKDLQAEAEEAWDRLLHLRINANSCIRKRGAP